MTDTKSTSGIYPRLCLAYLMQFMIWGSWATTLGGYADQVLKFNAGLLNTAITLAAASALFIGPIVDRKFCAQKMLAFLHLCGGICLIIASTITDFNLLFAFMLLHGLFFMPTLPLINSIVFRHIPNANNAPRVFVFGTAGWIIINLVVAVFLGGFQNSNFLVAGGVMAILLSIYSLTLPNTPPTPVVPGEKSASVFDVLALFKDKAFTIFAICVVIGGIPACGFYFPMSVPLLSERNYPSPVSLTTLNQFSELIFMLALPFFAARYGLKKCLILGLLSWCLRYLFFMQSAFTFALCGLLLHGFSYSFLYVASYMYAEKKAPAALKTSAQSLMAFLMLGVGQTLGSLMYAYETAQHAAPIASMAAVKTSDDGKTEEVKDAPLPTWVDPAMQNSAWRYLDLSATLQSALDKDEDGEEKPVARDLGTDVDKDGNGVITWTEIETINDAGLTYGPLTYPKANLEKVFTDVANHKAKEPVSQDKIEVSRAKWYDVQTKDWSKILLVPALLCGIFCLVFALLGKDPVPAEEAVAKKEDESENKDA